MCVQVAPGSGRILSVSVGTRRFTAVSCAKDARYGELYRVYLGDLDAEHASVEQLDSEVVFSTKAYGATLIRHDQVSLVGKLGRDTKIKLLQMPICKSPTPNFNTGRVDQSDWRVSDGFEMRRVGVLPESLLRLPREGSINAERLVEMIELEYSDLSAEMYTSGNPKRWFESQLGTNWHDLPLA